MRFHNRFNPNNWRASSIHSTSFTSFPIRGELFVQSFTDHKIELTISISFALAFVNRFSVYENMLLTSSFQHSENVWQEARALKLALKAEILDMENRIFCTMVVNIDRHGIFNKYWSLSQNVHIITATTKWRDSIQIAIVQEATTTI